MAQALYIHPTKQGLARGRGWRRGANPYPFLPIGVIGLVNLLRAQGLSVHGINHPMELLLDEGFDLAAWLDLHEDLHLILIDLHWYEHAYGAIQVARLCRRQHPEAWIVLGGFTATAFAEEILAFSEDVDMVIRGDAEWPLIDLVAALGDAPKGAAIDLGAIDLGAIDNLTHRRAGEIVSNPLTYCATERHLDTLDFVDLSSLDHHDEYAERQFSGFLPLRGHWLCIGRGCAHNCSYCGGGRDAQEALAGRKRVVLRSPGRVVRDIERLRNRGIDQVAFNLDISEYGRDYWGEVFQGLRQREIEIGIYNEFSTVPSTEFVETMAQSVDVRASRLAFSPLSGSEAVRWRNGKHYSNEEFVRALEGLKGHGFLALVYFSLNLPGEDDDAFQETLALARRLYDVYPESMIDVLNMCHTLDPLCPIAMDPESFGSTVSMRSFTDYYDYGRRTRRGGRAARSGIQRGFRGVDASADALERRADAWDRAGDGISTWHPIPRTW